MSRRAAEIRRDDTGRIFVTRAMAAALGHRDERTSRKHLIPVACDVPTRALLVHLDHAEDVLPPLGRRSRDKLRPLDM